MSEIKGFKIRVKMGLKKLRLSHTKVAGDLGVSPTTLSNWLTRGFVPQKHISGLAAILGITVDVLTSWMRKKTETPVQFSTKQLELSEADLETFMRVWKVVSGFSILVMEEIVKQLHASEPSQATVVQ